MTRLRHLALAVPAAAIAAAALAVPAADCEHADRGAAPSPAGDPGPTDSTGPKLALPARVKPGRNHKV
jgi:hypothetical protein